MAMSRLYACSENTNAFADANESVYVIACTNVPWELDAAALRRFEKRVLVDLPSRAARKEIIAIHVRKAQPRANVRASAGSEVGNANAGANERHHHHRAGLSPSTRSDTAEAVAERALASLRPRRPPSSCDALPDGALDALVDASEGFAGSDIAAALKEAMRRPLQRLLRVCDLRARAGPSEDKDKDKDKDKERKEEEEGGGKRVRGGETNVEREPVPSPFPLVADFEDALRSRRPAVTGASSEL